MQEHPEYNPRKDKLLCNGPSNNPCGNRKQFEGSRISYWMGRGAEDNAEALKLMHYYDYHDDVKILRWDSSRVDWWAVGLDTTSAVLSVVALNEVSNSQKFLKVVQGPARTGAAITGGISTAKALTEDGVKGALWSSLGFAPGPLGGMFSGASAIKGLTAGYYYESWQPSISR